MIDLILTGVPIVAYLVIPLGVGYIHHITTTKDK